MGWLTIAGQRNSALKSPALGGRETDFVLSLIFTGRSVRRSKETWFRVVSQTVAWRYSTALVAVLVSFFVRDLLNDWLIAISDRGLIVFLPAILLVTFFVGLGPAILTGLLSGLAAWYVFLPPYYSFALGLDGAIVLATFIVGTGVGIALVHWLRIAITAAEDLARQREVLI